MRNIHIIAVASHHPPWAAAAEDHYLRQMRFFRISLTAIKNGATKEKEATAIITRLPANARCILLERTGEAMNEKQFSTAVNNWLEDNRPLTFIIAGADGASEQLLAHADTKLSLSPFVFPHALARVILIEQLFRADCHLRRHPYPR